MSALVGRRTGSQVASHACGSGPHMASRLGRATGASAWRLWGGDVLPGRVPQSAGRELRTPPTASRIAHIESPENLHRGPGEPTLANAVSAHKRRTDGARAR